MNSKTIEPVQSNSLNIDESYFFKAEFALWIIFSSSLILNWSGLGVRFVVIEILFQISVILLAVYAALIPFIKSWYNLEDLSSAIYNLSGIILLIIGSTASSIYNLEWGSNVFMAGFCCTYFYHINSPFREKTYQKINKTEEKLVWSFVIGCLLSFPACFMLEELFPYPHQFFLYCSALGFIILLYTLVSFLTQWLKKQVSNYILLSYVPRLLIMLYFAKGYKIFVFNLGFI